MACRAILRGLSLPVARKTCAHIMRNRAFGDRALGNVSVARRAGDPCPIVRRMPELYMGVL